MSDSNAAVLAPPKEEIQQGKPKVQPPYGVIIENDDFHTFDYVIDVMQKIFGKSVEDAFKVAETIHTQGEAMVWSGSLEVAELKRDQIRSAGPDLYASKKVEFPLGVRLEPLR
jgi:ATP-dependent Clp protease adaptor protein ClpS